MVFRALFIKQCFRPKYHFGPHHLMMTQLGFGDTLKCHSRERGNPYLEETKFLMIFKDWIPAFAGMTCSIWNDYFNYDST